MKLSVSAFRAQASAQRKILSSYQNQLNYGTCTALPAPGRYKFDGKPQMMVDSTGLGPTTATNSNTRAHFPESLSAIQQIPKEAREEREEKETTNPPTGSGKQEGTPTLEKSAGRTRSKSNQRWMKLRTTVQLSGAISSTSQKSKPPLKREDSFLKRFSTRQIAEAQETIDTGDETETLNGSQTQNEVNRRRRKRRKEMSKTVVNPDENFYFYWLMTVTICVLYNLWTLIVRQSFPELQRIASAFWYSGDGFADVVFACDIVVQFRTGYLEQGLMVYNSKKLATHYLKSRAFILDVLSLLPLDFLQLNVGINPLLRFPRFLKIYRVYTYYYMVESRTVYPNLWRVVNLIHILLILAHWFGCFYYLLSEAEGFQGDWVYPYRPGDYATLTRKYLGSLYWSTLTLTTIGDLPTPETNAEYLFTIISYLIGVFIFATIVGQVGNVITNRNANRLEFERLLDGAKTYMRHHKVPGGMKRRVLRWYDYSWSRGRIQGGGDINTALGLLPDKLKTELALHVNLSVLKKNINPTGPDPKSDSRGEREKSFQGGVFQLTEVTIFQECQPEFLHDLVLKMKAYIFTPGDLICRKGEVAREMFIIADGILDVISETGRVLTTMKAGDFFGEIGILNLDGLNKRTADVRSVGYSELFSLSREDVLTAMKDYPEAQEILQSLGRKRLMEAKNASKIYKAQVKQARDHDSSGESDTAGKKIVEKLRSDVRGLKNALRRSRRETVSKETLEKAFDGSEGKTHSKKYSTLRRMNHVHSSDEYDANNDEHSPIGVGLPLLQRLKLLKEKQDKEREEREKNRVNVSDGSRTRVDENAGSEAAGIGLPFTQKLKLLKQKEVKDSTVHGSSTVRTLVTGMRSEKSPYEAKSISIPGESEKKVVGTKERDGTKDPVYKKRNSVERGKIPLKERLKAVHAGQVKEKILSSRNFQEAETVADSVSRIQRETSVNVPTAEEATKPVPKSLGNKFEVPKSRDAWKLLKKSSISLSKSGGKSEAEENKPPGEVPKKGTYLSKSDTVLERQNTAEVEEQRSDSNNSETLKQSLDGSTTERRKSGSGSPEPRVEEDFEDSSVHFVSQNKNRMKKYNSISDLSPEYAGLPFVKKLKILNERQKLEELEKELVVRSASLDVPERPETKGGSVLVRSQSEAGTFDNSAKAPTPRAELEETWEKEMQKEHFAQEAEPLSEPRGAIHDEKRDIHLESSVASPESNETLERRNLKSILKKLSAEDSTSDEDQILRNSRRVPISKRKDTAELKKLMRAPTVEGYAARHKKLTKSVTFDSDTPPSPPDALPGQHPDENKGRGHTPKKPTAILTLQLSNLSMIPIAGPKKTDAAEHGGQPDGGKHSLKHGSEAGTGGGQKPEPSREERHELATPNNDRGKQSPPTPCALREPTHQQFRVSPFVKRPDEDFFSEIKGGLLLVLQQFLDEVENNFQSQFSTLRNEVETRDEIILQLQSRIWELERVTLHYLDSNQRNESYVTRLAQNEYPCVRVKNLKETESNSTVEFFETIAGVSGTNSDLADGLAAQVSCDHVFPRMRSSSAGQMTTTSAAGVSLNSGALSQPENRFEAPGEVGSSATEPPDVSASPRGLSAREERCSSKEGRSDGKRSNFPDDYLGDVLKNENEEGSNFEAKDTVSLLPKQTESVQSLLKPRGRKSPEPPSGEELELSELPLPFEGRGFREKKRGTEFRLRRNFSMEETLLDASKCEKARRRRKEVESRSKKSFINRVTELHRTFSCSQERNTEFVALDIDDSPDSSDIENLRSNDWEVQMLVEELAKKGPNWEDEEDEEGEEKEEVRQEWMSETVTEHLDDIRQLQQEVNKLKQMVCGNDVTRLTSSELDILETIMQAKDQGLSQMTKSNSLNDEGRGNEQMRQIHGRMTERRKKPTLRQKIGQALSFDFHDIQNRKPTSSFATNNGTCLKKQNTISCSLQQRQNVQNLWHTSTQLRSRVFEDRETILENGNVRSSATVGAGSSLPILVSSFLDQEKNNDLRMSLPLLSSRMFRPNLSEQRSQASASSHEEPHPEGDFRRGRDAAFEVPQPPSESTSAGEPGIFASPATRAPARPLECHPGTSLNSFIKSVGQRVRQVMGGEANPVRNQVPTISRLCDEQTEQTDAEMRTSQAPGEGQSEDVGLPSKEKSEILNPFDGDPKIGPPDC